MNEDYIDYQNHRLAIQDLQLLDWFWKNIANEQNSIIGLA